MKALKVWLWRGIEKISWRDRVSIQNVLIIVEERRCLMKTICQRKKKWIGHVLRGDGLLKDVLEGRMLGKKRRGRPRAKMIDDLMEKPKPKGRRREEREFSPSSASSSCSSDSEEGEREGRMKLRSRKRKKPRRWRNLYKKMKKRAEKREAWREWVPKTCLRAEYS